MTYTPSKFPPASPVTADGSDSDNMSGNGTLTVVLVTIPKTGQWVVEGEAGFDDTGGSGSPEVSATCELFVNSVLQDTAVVAESNSGTVRAPLFWRGHIVATQGVTINVSGGVSGRTWGGYGDLKCTFVPTAAYPQ